MKLILFLIILKIQTKSNQIPYLEIFKFPFNYFKLNFVNS